jgi:hypothetical protein
VFIGHCDEIKIYNLINSREERKKKASILSYVAHSILNSLNKLKAKETKTRHVMVG